MTKPIVCCALVLAGIVCLLTPGKAEEATGQALYEGHCSQCHGADGRGARGPRLVPFDWTYEQALEQIRRPECDMPPIPASQVSDDGVAQIVAYLKTIK